MAMNESQLLSKTKNFRSNLTVRPYLRTDRTVCSRSRIWRRSVQIIAINTNLDEELNMSKDNICVSHMHQCFSILFIYFPSPIRHRNRFCIWNSKMMQKDCSLYGTTVSHLNSATFLAWIIDQYVFKGWTSTASKSPTRKCMLCL